MAIKLETQLKKQMIIFYIRSTTFMNLLMDLFPLLLTFF